MTDRNRQPHEPSRFSAITFQVVLLAGFIGAVLNPALLEPPEAAIADGSWASDYQQNFTARFMLLEPAQAFWNTLDLLLFNQAPAGVLSGSDGWLFTEEEYAHDADHSGLLARWAGIITDVATELDAGGVQLLVAVVPAKASSVSALAPPLPAAARGRYQQLLDLLAAAGIPATDLRSGLSSETAWLRTDTHWTPEGAAAAASLIARAAAELAPELRGAAAFEAEVLEPLRHEGDLARLLALGPFSDLVGPGDQLISRVQVTSLESEGLFADPELDVALVGTSYSAASEWSLADRLRLELQSDVLDASQSGVGPLVPMREFLDSSLLADSPPVIVIWEIPERYLSGTEFLPAPGGDS